MYFIGNIVDISICVFIVYRKSEFTKISVYQPKN